MNIYVVRLHNLQTQLTYWPNVIRNRDVNDFDRSRFLHWNRRSNKLIVLKSPDRKFFFVGVPISAISQGGCYYCTYILVYHWLTHYMRGVFRASTYLFIAYYSETTGTLECLTLLPSAKKSSVKAYLTYFFSPKKR